MLKNLVSQHVADSTGVQISQADGPVLKQLAAACEINLDTIRGYAVIEDRMLRSTVFGPAEIDSSREAEGDGAPSEKDVCNEYSAEFVRLMMQVGVFLPGGLEDATPEAQNWTELRQVSSLPRSPWSLRADQVRDSRKAIRWVSGQSETLEKMMELVTADEGGMHHSGRGVRFYGMEPLHKAVLPPLVNHYDGCRLEEIDPTVRRELKRVVMPSQNVNHPAAPNFFTLIGESDSTTLMREAMYCGALGARAMFRLQNYGRSTPIFDGNAYAISTTVFDGVLKIYATFPHKSATSEEPEFFMDRIGAYDLGGKRALMTGIDVYRNVREWAHQQRDRLITMANDVAQAQSAPMPMQGG